MKVTVDSSGLGDYARRQINSTMKRKGVSMKCPKCGRKYPVFDGVNFCPFCNAGNDADLKV